MQILIKREDFSTSRYELNTGSAALEFTGENDAFSLPYSEVKDFCITRNDHGKTYFTMLCEQTMYEGQILDLKAVESFVETLKTELGGVIHIAVKKN